MILSLPRLVIAVEFSFSIVEGVQRVLVPVEIKSYPFDGHHEEEQVVVPPHPLVVFMSL